VKAHPAATWTSHAVLLCSDIHLSDANPALTEAFCAWIERSSQRISPESLLVLGDLFDAWVGDDVLVSHQSECAQTIANLFELQALKGIRIGLMHGNRDFLIGQQFAKQCNAQLLSDPCVLTVSSGLTVALTHGDQLCTQDSDYQAFRQQVRAARWQDDFLAKPLKQRLEVAHHLRAQSELEKKTKSMEIMDITPAEAERLAEQLAADVVLHGHTHRPGLSPMSNGRKRWVLPDWEVNAAGELQRGGGLLIHPDGIEVISAARV
jgi:UDP-2,3-diacylglucosamine hydrolase